MRWFFVIGLAALAFLVLLFPLSAVTSRLAPGLEAEEISGTIWRGRLRNAQYAGLPLGDVDVGLDPERFLKGEASLRFQRLGPRLSGRAGGTRQDRRLEDLNGELPLQLLPPPAPAVTIRFQDVHVSLTARGACRKAGGEVSTSLSGIPFLGELPPLTGTPACDGNRLFTPLRLAGDRAGLDLWLAADGGWTGKLRFRPDSRLVLAALSVAGFAIEGEDATLTAYGQLRLGG